MFSGGAYQWEGGVHNVRVSGGEHGRCILYSYMEWKNENVLRRGVEGRRENNGGENLTKIYCEYIGKCHNLFPSTTIIC
jgi:hypothetical protein